jgi:hypothetical protein
MAVAKVKRSCLSCAVSKRSGFKPPPPVIEMPNEIPWAPYTQQIILTLTLPTRDNVGVPVTDTLFRALSGG